MQTVDFHAVVLHIFRLLLLLPLLLSLVVTEPGDEGWIGYKAMLMEKRTMETMSQMTAIMATVDLSNVR
jgi:hypothetical protein